MREAAYFGEWGMKVDPHIRIPKCDGANAVQNLLVGL